MTRRRDISLRAVARGDIGAVQDLAARIWREHYPGIITREQIEYMLGKMYATAVIQDEILAQGYRYVMALSDVEPVGFVAYAYEPGEQSVKISKLYLLPSHHGKGIGRLLLLHVQEHARKLHARNLHLFVNRNNAKAIRAYERFGFRKAGEVIADIGSGFVMDDFRMELRL